MRLRLFRRSVLLALLPLEMLLVSPLAAQPMVLDPDFAPTLERGYSVANRVRLVPAPDRQTIVLGNTEPALTQIDDLVVSHRIARLLADGSPDATFTAQLPDPADTVGDAVVLGDGRIVAVVYSGTGQNPTRVLRLLASGKADPSFLPLELSGGQFGNLTLLSDGSVIVWGSFAGIGGVDRKSLARVQPDGSVDSVFAPVITDAGLGVRSLVATPDDRVVFNGESFLGQPLSSHFNRLTRTGAIDSSFTPALSDTSLLLLAALSDNRLLVSTNGLHRLNADGSNDLTYAPQLGGSAIIRRAILLPGDRLAVEAATSSSDDGLSSVFVLKPDGALELDCRQLPGAEQIQNLAGVRSDGTVVIAQGPLIQEFDPYSKRYISGMNEPKLCIVDPTAQTLTTLPTTFEANSRGSVGGLSVDSTHGIVTEGYFSRIAGVRRNGLARFYPDGTLDRTFDPVAVTPVFHLPDGRIIGQRSTLGPPDAKGFHPTVTEIVRLKADGTIDLTFPPSASTELVSASWLALAPDGRVLVGLFEGGVAIENTAKLVWLAANGTRAATLSTTFAGFPPYGGTPSFPVQSATVLADGKLLLGVDASTVNGAASTFPIRLNADGSTDPSYHPTTNSLSRVTEAKPLADGRAYVFGLRDEPGGTQSNAVLRLHPDGSPDIFVPEAIGRGIPLSDGSFIFQAQRFHADGTRDLNFSLGITNGYSLQSAVLADDGSIWIGGYFAEVMGQPRNGLARLVPAPVEGFTVQPQNAKIYLGLEAAFEGELGLADPATFQWTHNGTPIAGATSRSLQLTRTTRADAGEYRLVATVGSKTYTSAAATLTLELDPNRAHLIALSGRSWVPRSADGPPQIGGLIIHGEAPRPVLLRAVGLGLGSVLPSESLLTRPALRLFRGDTAIAEDVGGIANTDVANAARRVGAFPLPAAGEVGNTIQGSALLLSLEPGLYTAHSFDQQGGSGISLFEIYDADTGAAAPFASGISLRGHAGTGDNVLIVGFIIRGAGTAEVLIRGAGPDLRRLGVPDALVDPQVTLFTSSGSTVNNDNWQDQPDLSELIAATQRAQLTPFTAGSRDAALHVKLPAGIYTVHGSGVNNTTGEMLLEIYTIDP